MPEKLTGNPTTDSTFGRRRITSNLAANLVGRGWHAIVAFLFLPVYLRFLGGPSFGVLTFAVTLQIALGVAGQGLGVALRRHFASGGDDQASWSDRYRALRVIETVYITIALIVVVGIVVGSDAIASSWLHAEGVEENALRTAIRLMGVSIGCQMLATNYAGCLYGLGRQVEINARSIAYSALRQLSGLCYLAFGGESLWVLFGVFAVCDFVYLVVIRRRVQSLVRRHALRPTLRESWRSGLVSTRLVVGLTGLALITMLNNQFDKIVISRLLPVSSLGIYTLAFTLAWIPGVFATALANALFPLFTRYFACGDTERLQRLFTQWRCRASCVIIPAALTLAVYAEPIIQLWTRNQLVAAEGAPAARLLAVASALYALQVMRLELLLASGKTVFNLAVGIFSLPFLALITTFMTKHYGLVGAALAACVLQLFVLFAYCMVFAIQWPKHQTSISLIVEFIVPSTISLTLCLGVTALLPSSMSVTALFGTAAATGIGALLVSFILSEFFQRKLLAT